MVGKIVGNKVDVDKLSHPQKQLNPALQQGNLATKLIM